MNDFASKSVLVTGGGRGIGAQTCREFAKRGAAVFVNYLHSRKEAESLAREVGGIALKADVSNPSGVEKMRNAILRKTGGTLDILINNAGVIDRVSSALDVTEGMWGRMVDVNLKGTFLCTQAFAPALLESRGCIVNVSSTAHFQCAFPAAHYNASKAGVVALTKTYARQLAPRVRVNCVAPGFIQTNFQNEYSKERQGEILKEIPLARFGKPGDVAKVVAALCTGEFSYVTGQTLVVDGGRVMVP
ncbi:glucose 1-dehydrogenase [Candidatus Micrarchaeota archaeon]|nr:glucose 1-dehydrogenase [Candidatus Micrarchaeota archaeon]MBI5177314.1 glucose 1-dehydrogenase [Candidatus Micrarchaeota archaeon]